MRFTNAAHFAQTIYDLLHLNKTSQLNILLPVGISFFIFQALSYVIDIYRRAIPVERSATRFFL